MRSSASRLCLGSKRGQWLQFTFVIVMMLVIGIVFLALSKFNGDINDAVQNDEGMSNESKVMFDNQTTSTYSVFDSGFMIVLLGVWFLCLGLAYNSGSSPFLFIIALFIIVAVGFAGMIMSNSWGEISDDADFSSTAASLPMTDFVLSNFLVVILVMGFTTLLVGFTQRGGF